MARQPNRSAVFRFAHIDSRLRTGRHPTAAILADELGVSVRTIFRDIEYMRDMLGAPIEHDPEVGGYVYTRRGFRLPALTLSEGELVALLVAAQVARAYAGSPIAEEVEDALERLAGLLPDEVTVTMSDLAAATSFAVSAPRVSDVERIAELCRATRERLQLRIRYHSLSSGRTSSRIVDPYHMLCLDGSWYVVAYCHTRRDVRLFVPERIESVDRTGRAFSVPDDFDVQSYMGDAFRVMRGGRTRRVRLRFRGRSADYVAERRWHRSQKLTRRNDTCVLEMRVSHLDEVAAWALSFGGECEVLSPKTLRDRVRSLARAAARRNGG